MKEVFHQELYSFNFESIFIHQDLLESFYTFVCAKLKVKSDRKFEFLKEYRKLQWLKSPDDKHKQAERIVTLYIQKHSDQELKLVQGVREKIFTDYEAFQLFMKEKGDEFFPEFFYDDLFQNVQKSILSDLQRDEFPHFYKSKEFKAAIKPHLNDHKVIILNHVKDFSYCDKDFEMFYATQKDLQIMAALEADQHSWDLLEQQKEEYSSWWCERNYFPNVTIISNSCFSKSVVNVAQPYEKMIYMLLNTKNIKFLPYLSKLTIIDPMVAVGEIKTDLSPNLIQNSFIAMLEYHFTYPINIVRRAPVVFGMYCHPKKDEVVLVWKPCPLDEFVKVHQKMPFGEKLDWIGDTSKKEHMYLMFDFGGIHLKKSFSGTQVTHLGVRKFGGTYAKKDILQHLMKQSTKTLKSNIEKLMEGTDTWNLEAERSKSLGDPLGAILIHHLIAKQREREKRESVFID